MIAYLYPGQGSQHPGMLTGLPPHPAVESTLDEVSSVIGHDVKDLDTSDLADTVAAQLALYTVGVASARVLSADGIYPGAVAGHSIGAFAAAVTAGALTLQEGVRAVRIRSQSMRHLYPSGFGLLAVMGHTLQCAQRLVEATRGPNDLFVAMENAEDQIVLAGSDDAFDRVYAAAANFGVRQVRRLEVSVPSHCALMEPVVQAVANYLHTLPPRRPTAEYLCASTGRRATTSDAMLEDLSCGVAQMVRWRDCTDLLAELGAAAVVQMPPGHATAALFAAAHQGIPVVALDDAPLDDSSKRLKKILDRL